jgi:hypothetical protein
MVEAAAAARGAAAPNSSDSRINSQGEEAAMKLQIELKST